MSAARQPPSVIEISSSSSAAPSPVYHMNGRHDEDEPMDSRGVSAASRVSLANLLGPAAPSSPYASPSGGSPRKRFSDAHSANQRARSPPYSPSSPSHALASTSAAMMEDRDMAPRRRYPDILGEPSHSTPRRRSSRGSPGADTATQDQALTSGTATHADEGDGPDDSAAADQDEDNEDDEDEDEDEDDDRGEGGAGDEDGDGGSSEGGSASEGEGEGEGEGEEGEGEGEGGADGTAGAEGGETSKTKPKVKRRPRKKTPEIPEPISLGPPPRPTIRISLKEAKKDGYFINVPSLVYSKLKTEQHPWATWFESQMEVVDAPAPAAAPAPAPAPDIPADIGGDPTLAALLAKYPAQTGPAPKKRRRGGRSAEDDAYDVNDPFVDDSELGVDEPTHFAKPKADGFYVTLGPVELAKVKPAKGRGGAFGPGRERVKPLSIRDAKSGFAGSINKLIAKRGQITTVGPVAPVAGSSADGSSTMQVGALLNGTTTANGSAVASPQLPGSPARNGSAAGDGQRATSAEGSRESPIKVDEIDDSQSRSKKPRYPTRPVDPRLQAAFENLKRLVATESFAVKSKFPPSLKGPLVETAKLAVELGEYNDNFFNYLPTIFPYNRFTMMKLTKREFFPHHINYFKELQDEHMETLGRLVQESYPQQLAEYEAAHRAWEERGGPEQEGDERGANGAGAAMDVDGVPQPPLNDEDLQEPQKRWKWTEEMREEVFTLINIENAMSEIHNEKLKLENAPEQFSEINARKSCYKTMAELWPEDGWTTSTNISREYAQLKKKKDRLEARMEAEYDGSRASSLMP